MTAPHGVIVILPAQAEGAPLWLKVADGQIVSRSESAALAGLSVEDDSASVMLVVPPAAVTIRRVELPGEMPPAQARMVALRMAREASISEADGLHAVLLDGDEDGLNRSVAVIARDDMAHFIAWGRHHGLEADIVLPAAAVLPVPDDGFVAATIGGADVLHGQGMAVDAAETWMQALVGDAAVRRLDRAQVESALVAALAKPPVNLRSGEFARPQDNGVDGAYIKRLAVWTGFIALATLLISLMLIARYHWSASRLDAETIEMARTVLPAANDAQLVGPELDRMLGAKSASGYGFTGPVAGLMSAMQPVPGVSLSALSRGDNGLVHATLASARAEDINTVLFAVQAAGYTITATSSADPGGRVIAEITVQP
tara:strand:- start:7506 stop:8621 length:1116 start_codon:yes stop_codon:yes gene_type:complete